MSRTMTSVILSALLVSAAGAANTWSKIDSGKTGRRHGSVMVPTEAGILLLGGGVKGAAYVQSFDAKALKRSDVTKAAPKLRHGLHPYYQTAYDPKTKTVYCFDGGTLWTFNVGTKAWKSFGRPAELGGLSWHSVAIDLTSRKLVVVGSDKRADNLGWTRTVVLDLDSDKWSALALPGDDVVKAHKERAAAKAALIDLIGRVRLAWYRDPDGTGTDVEREALDKRCTDLKAMAGMAACADGISKVAALLGEKKTLDALKAARALLRTLEEEMEAQYPVPPSRRNSPLVFDAKNKVFVLFGGDHEDYQMNDTWVLDLKTGWTRTAPKLAPSPRAGHQLVYLPKSGKIALYEGYVATSSTNYGARPYSTINPRQLWLYDVKASRWTLAGAWTSKKGGAPLPSAAGFYGYAAQHFNAPAMAATADDQIVLVAGGTTWLLKVGDGQTGMSAPPNTNTLGKKPNQRRYRAGRFLASYCEVDTKPKTVDLDNLTANKWVAMPAPPRNVMYGCRKRDWGTAVWDAKNEQVVRWGGGHCVRSASTPVHYSFASNRMVEGYDADEPYGRNGGGGYGSSVMGRPWVPTHGYNLYAYDPPSGLIVTAYGHLYDPARMDWLRMTPAKRPFSSRWSSTVLETSAHGVVAWASSSSSRAIGLWLYKHGKGWVDLKPKGKLFKPYCDSDGMCYDSKRDRMLLGWGGGYGKNGDGTLRSFDFKTRAIQVFKPGNLKLGAMYNTREMVYVEHADMVLFGSGGRKVGKTVYTIAYDCAKNKYLLLDAGPVTYGHGAAWMYDAKRKLVLATSHTRGIAYALKLDPKTATLLEKAK
jgi:hypothetical protein